MQPSFLSHKLKRLFLSLGFCIFGSPAFASHLMGGELIATSLPGGFYAVRLSLYRDAGPTNANLESWYEYKYNSANANGFPNLSSVVKDTLVMDSSLSTPLMSGPYPIEARVYTDTIQLAPGKNWITFNMGVRNSAILNINNPDGQDLALSTELTVPVTGVNSSPRFLIPPVPYFIVNAAANYNPLPYDPDGDSLVWNLVTPRSGDSWTSGSMIYGRPILGFTSPPGAASNPFSLNSFTGNISWTPNTLGNFVQSFQVDEYRNGVKIGSIVRDYQYIVINGDTGSVPNMSRSANVLHDAANRYYYVEYTPGQMLSFSVTGTVGHVLEVPRMTAHSSLLQSPNPPAFTTNSTSSNNITGTLQWTPPFGYRKTIPVVIRQYNGYVYNDFTVLLKPKTTPSSVRNTSLAGTAILYPNPSSNGSFQLLVDFPSETELQVRIYNTLGQLAGIVYEGKVPGKQVLSSNKELAPGNYLVQLQDASGKSETLPLLVK